jgi:hypothetical protein
VPDRPQKIAFAEMRIEGALPARPAASAARMSGRIFDWNRKKVVGGLLGTFLLAGLWP